MLSKKFIGPFADAIIGSSLSLFSPLWLLLGPLVGLSFAAPSGAGIVFGTGLISFGDRGADCFAELG